jgi:gluconate 5-dehydrogenase
MSTSILQQFRLDGQAALVVGGNRGLGFEIAKSLAEAGASIGIIGRDTIRNDQSQEFILTHFSRECVAFSCDVTAPQHVADTVAAAVQKFGKIDILINSSGINIRGTIEQLTPEDFDRVQRTNVTGMWLMCRQVVPLMKRHRYGRIVNVASALSVIAIPERTPYATSKGAALQLTRALAVELAHENITVNALLPGMFATEMTLPLSRNPELHRQFQARIPMGRWAELHEIGGLAHYLASPASSYVTGAGFSIDGGWTAQ